MLEQNIHEMHYNSFQVQCSQRSKFNELINKLSSFGALGSLERVSTFTSFLKFLCSLSHRSAECRVPSTLLYFTQERRENLYSFDMSYQEFGKRNRRRHMTFLVHPWKIEFLALLGISRASWALLGVIRTIRNSFTLIEQFIRRMLMVHG